MSVLGQLSGSPRLWKYMVGLLPSAVGLGMISVARLTYATESFGDESGFGSIGLLAALGGVIVSVPTGVAVDRFDARRVAMTAAVVLAAVYGFEALVVAQPGALPRFGVIVVALLQGAATAAAFIAFAKVQASLVPVDARGSAEIVNLVRLGVGGAVGTLLAVRLGIPEVAMAAGALGMVLVGLTTWRVAVPVPGVQGAGHGLRELLERLRHLQPLRAAVVADLLLWLLVPTQAVGTMLVDLAAQEYTAVSLTAGFLGVLLGRLLLVRHGVSGKAPLRITVALSLQVAVLIVGWLGLMTGWVLQHSMAVAALVGLASACGAYALGLTGALVQQRSPDDIRGRLTAALFAVRNLVVGIGVLFVTVGVGVWHSQVWLLALSAVTLIVLLGMRGFRAVGTQP